MGVVETVVRVRLEVPPPGAAMDAGLKAAVAPEGRPEALKAMAELKPPVTAVVMTLVPEDPWLTLSAAGAAETVKAGAPAVATEISSIRNVVV